MINTDWTLPDLVNAMGHAAIARARCAHWREYRSADSERAEQEQLAGQQTLFGG